MKKIISRRRMVALLGTAPLVGGLLAGSPAAGQDAHAQPPEPRKWREVSARERFRERHFPNVVLTTHEGKRVRFYEDLMKDKIVIINFMYAKCEGVCPPITNNLVRVQKALGSRVGKDIFIYSFTLKPEQDTPARLAEYARMHKAGPGWLFLTGTKADLELLRRKLGFTDPDPRLDADASSHIGNLRYGNEALSMWGACPGLSRAGFIAESVLWLDWPHNKKESARNVGARKEKAHED
jgi:protein SCO1